MFLYFKASTSLAKICKVWYFPKKKTKKNHFQEITAHHTEVFWINT